MPVDNAELRAAGRRAADLVWEAVDDTPIELDDPLLPAFADAALARLEELQAEAPGVMKRILEGSDRGAEGLNADPLAEVVQNADDAGAREVRFAVTERPKSVLLMAHSGGERVHIDHVLPMSFAFLSTKRASAELTGKFGVGLQTLNELGRRLEVHCAPYSFLVEGQQIRRVPSRRRIAGIYGPSKFDTLLALHLRPDVDLDDLRGWVSRWGADSMLFLRHVRRIAAIDPAKPKRARASIELRTVRETRRRLTIRGAEVPCVVSELRGKASGERFIRFLAEVPVPNSVKPRANKATATWTPMGFALGGERGRFFAGLPLRLAPSLPWSVHAQLDPELSRNSLKHNPWNDWVLKRLAEVISSVIVDRFSEGPAKAWAAVPLDDELDEQPDPWLQERVQRLFDDVRSAVVRRTRISEEGRSLALADFAYEDERLTPLLSGSEVARLTHGRVLLPRPLRDPSGRWRQVLDELSVAAWLGPAETRALLDWSDADLANRAPRWFSRLTSVLVNDDPDATWDYRCLVLADGRRVSPRELHDEGRLLVRDATSAGLAQRLGRVVALHPDYLGRSESSRAVQEWLVDRHLLVPAPSGRDALRAIARGPEDAPLRLRDQELLALREAVDVLPDSESKDELLRDLGRRLTVDAVHYIDGSPVKSAVRISSVYLPAAFEGRATTWSRAAGRVPGLHWLDRRYARRLRLPEEKGPSAARDFLVALGAEVAPRLQRVKTTTFNREVVSHFSRHNAPEFQAQAAEDRGYLRFVRGDRVSRALRAVVRDIAAAEEPARDKRAIALIRTLHDSWDRLYDDHATIRAFKADRTLFPRGRIPATWIADAASVPWVENELGEPCNPCDLVLRTSEYLSTIGDEPAGFVRGLGQKEADWPVLEAIGISSRPRAKHLVEQLVELQRRDLDEPSDENTQRARFVYLVLSSMCPRGNLRPDTMVDDLSVRGLRRRFAATAHRPGLVRTDNGWHAPAEVLSGRAVFGHRRPFVPATSAAANLWRTLRIEPPTVEGCVAVLKEIARDSTGPKERAVLADTYRYISTQLRSGARRPAALQRLPLWTGKNWVTRRAIYAMDDRELAGALAERTRSPVWQPPAALGPLVSFMQGARITKINENTIKLTPGTRKKAMSDGFLQERFRLATLHLRAALAEEDEVAHNALAVGWDDFHEAAVKLVQPLEVEVPLGQSKPTRVGRRAHLDLPALTLYVTEQLDLGDEHAGGRAVATAFPASDQPTVALRWTAAWRRAERMEQPDVMRLAPRQQEDIRKLLEQMEISAKSPKAPLKPRTRPSRQANDGKPDGSPSLKEPDDLTNVVDVAIVEPDNNGGSTRQRKGLRKKRPARGSGSSAPAPLRKKRSDDDAWDPEDIAIEAVRLALWQVDESEIQDVSRLRGLGADALREDDFIEVKHNRRGLPLSITLTANEFERAHGEQERFILAIAYDLDKDVQTRVRFYVDPLTVLQKLPQTSVSLGGLKSTPALEVTFGDPDGDEPTNRGGPSR